MQFEIENIINGCIAGDKSSQYKLYKFLASKLMVVCRRYMKSREEAEDCLQESFIKIFTKLKTFKGEGEFGGWARRITINTIITKLNKAPQLMSSIDIGDEIITTQSINNPLNDLNEEDLLSLINSLSDDKRIVFNLYAIEGFSHKEISEMLGISEVNSRIILSRARQVLFSQLQKKNTGYEEYSTS